MAHYSVLVIQIQQNLVSGKQCFYKAHMVHHWPKELLIWHCIVLFWARGTVNYDYIITNSINFLLIGSRCIPNGTHTNHC